MRLLMRRFFANRRPWNAGCRFRFRFGGVEQGGAVPLWRNPLMTEC